MAEEIMKIRFYFENERNAAHFNFFVRCVNVDLFVLSLKNSPPSDCYPVNYGNENIFETEMVSFVCMCMCVCSTSKLVQLEPKQKAGDDENIL